MVVLRYGIVWFCSLSSLTGTRLAPHTSNADMLLTKKPRTTPDDFLARLEVAHMAAAEPPKTWAQRLSELWLQDPKAVVAGMGKWPNGKSQSSAIASMITTHPDCGLGPIIAGMAAWNNIYAAADVLATLRLDEQVCKEIRCDRFYHIMEHLEAWPNMEYAYELLDAWWFLATADEEARPYVGDWLLELWTDERKIEEFAALAEEGGWGAEDEWESEEAGEEQEDDIYW